MALLDLAKVAINTYVKLDFDDLKSRPWFLDWYKLNYGNSRLEGIVPTGVHTCRASDQYGNVRFVRMDVSDGKFNGFYLPRKVVSSSPGSAVKYDFPSAPAKATIIKNVPQYWGLDATPHCIQSTGWDPEIFVEDGDGNLLPAFTFLPDKAHSVVAPLPTEGASRQGRMFYDGFAAEYTTWANSCHGYGMDTVRAGMKAILEQARIKCPKAKLSLKSVYRIPQQFLTSSAAEQVALGCEPSMNAYGHSPLVVEDARVLPYRVAGGHIHFGAVNHRDMGKLTDADITSRIKAMDMFLALACVGIFADVDDPIRREFYGKAGEFRAPNYGFEYRVLSNAWLCDPQVAHLVMDLARRAVAAGPTMDKIFEATKLSEEKLQEIINYCDVKAARKFFEKNWAYWEHLMAGLWPRHYVKGDPTAPPYRAFKQIVMGGVGEGFPNFENIESNWRFSLSWARHSNDSKAVWATHVMQPKYQWKEPVCATTPIAPSVLTAEPLTQARVALNYAALVRG